MFQILKMLQDKQSDLSSSSMKGAYQFQVYDDVPWIKEDYMFMF